MSDQEKPVETILEIKADLANKVNEELGQNVYLCYQCVKCTSGCPVAKFFDWQPNQIMRAIQLGQEDIVLNAKTPWLCASCQTCTTRCPQGLDIAGIMDYLTRLARDTGVKPPVPEVDIFNEAFMREVRLWGRAYELGLMAEMKLRTMNLTDDLDLGFRMISKGKLGIIPQPTRIPRNIKAIPDADRAVAYYPGCSLHSSGKEFDASSRAVCEALGLDLIEPKGWICCGSSAAHRADPVDAIRLPMENLSLIEQSGFDEVTMPCAACFSRHKFAQYEIRHHSDCKERMDDLIGYEYQDRVKVTTLLDAIRDRVGLEAITEKVVKPLGDLKVVCYYGCLLTRPPEVTEAEHPENPTNMDEILSSIGAEVLDWSYKTACCGAAHSLTRKDIVLQMSGGIVNHAREVGADVIAVACPLCHLNLDARQFQMDLDEPMPVLYFTQLMSLALGLPEDAAALNKNLVDPRPLLKERGVI